MGVPLDRFVAESRERAAHTMGRRRFLEIGAAATAPLIAGCADDGVANPVDRTVAIVGGGIAGLHCAYRLRRAGVIATVYEASPRIGGRMFTDRSVFPDGMHCELGGELIDSGHRTMLDLASELGIELLDYTKDDPSLDHLVAHFTGERLTEMEILQGFSPIAAKIDEALASLIDQEDLYVYYNKPNGGEGLDALSIKAWLDSINAAGPVRDLLEVAYNIEYGLETDVSNVLNLMFLISTDTAEFEAFGDSDERFHTKDGNDTFPTRLAAELDPAQIELDTALEALRRAPDGRYVLSLSTGGSAREVLADHVVLALPFTILRELDLELDLPEPKRTAIAELGYGTNAKLMCGFSSRPWRTSGKSNGEVFTDLPIQATWETSRLQPGASGIITNFTGGDRGVAIGDGTPEEQMKQFLESFNQIFPGASAASNGKVARMHWPTHPFTKASYSAYKVGQYTKITGAEIERVENLHFCGEHTSLDAQGYMEGGALTGAMAALEISKDLGLDVAAQAARIDPRIGDARAAERRILERAATGRALRRIKRALPRWRRAG